MTATDPGPDEQPADSWTNEQAVVNDVRLHYVEAGDTDDPLVVLLHGFPEFWYSWRKQILVLADAGYHVVAPDMRGYNRSEKPHGVVNYRLSELVGDVAGLVEHLDAEAAHVVGHDWGGVVAWETAIRRSAVVETLAVLNAPHPGAYRRELLTNPDQWRRSWYALAFQLPWLPELALGLGDCAGVARLLAESSHPGTFTDQNLRRYREAACRSGALGSSLNYYRAAFRENLRREVRTAVGRATGGLVGDDTRRSLDVTMPTLVIWGEQDPALGVDVTGGLERWVDDLRIERLPDATHWVQQDAPETVKTLLTEHWA